MTRSLLDKLATRIQREELFERERKHPETRALGILLYHLGMSCRSVARLLTNLVEPVSRTPISTWYRRASDLFRALPARRHEVLVVDETSLHIEGENGELEEHFLWVAVDPRTSEIVHVALTQGRGGVEALGFFQAVEAKCLNEPFVHVDAGPWYPWPLEYLGWEYEVTSGGVRSKVETWNGVLKHRVEAFRRRFPWNACPEGIEAWCRAFAFVWNLLPWKSV